jgi:hypothetical protein
MMQSCCYEIPLSGKRYSITGGILKAVRARHDHDIFPVGWSMWPKGPTTPDVPWFPDHHLLDRQTTVVAVHEASIESGHVYSLGELIDIAESNSPTTQAA